MLRHLDGDVLCDGVLDVVGAHFCEEEVFDLRETVVLSDEHLQTGQTLAELFDEEHAEVSCRLVVLASSSESTHGHHQVGEVQHVVCGELVDLFFEERVLHLLVLLRIFNLDLLAACVEQHELFEWRVLQHLHYSRLYLDGHSLDPVELEGLYWLVVFDAQCVLEETHHVFLFFLSLAFLVQVELELFDAVHGLVDDAFDQFDSAVVVVEISLDSDDDVVLQSLNLMSHFANLILEISGVDVQPFELRVEGDQSHESWMTRDEAFAELARRS